MDSGQRRPAGNSESQEPGHSTLVEAVSTVAGVAHSSDSAEQQAAESLILAGLGGEYGRLEPATLKLTGGARVDVDGVAPDLSVFVEAFAHQGRMRGAQPKKVARRGHQTRRLRHHQHPPFPVRLRAVGKQAAPKILGTARLRDDTRPAPC